MQRILAVGFIGLHSLHNCPGRSISSSDQSLRHKIVSRDIVLVGLVASVFFITGTICICFCNERECHVSERMGSYKCINDADLREPLDLPRRPLRCCWLFGFMFARVARNISLGLFRSQELEAIDGFLETSQGHFQDGARAAPNEQFWHCLRMRTLSDAERQ